MRRLQVRLAAVACTVALSAVGLAGADNSAPTATITTEKHVAGDCVTLPCSVVSPSITGVPLLQGGAVDAGSGAAGIDRVEIWFRLELAKRSDIIPDSAWPFPDGTNLHDPSFGHSFGPRPTTVSCSSSARTSCTWAWDERDLGLIFVGGVYTAEVRAIDRTGNVQNPPIRRRVVILHRPV